MKKLDIKKQQKTIMTLLNRISAVTKEAKNAVEWNDIDNLKKNIKLRNVLLSDLQLLCRDNKLSEDESKLLQEIEKDSELLIKSVTLIKEKLSVDLISLYDAKQVIKYY